jgi:hypothetical protein
VVREARPVELRGAWALASHVSFSDRQALPAVVLDALRSASGETIPEEATRPLAAVVSDHGARRQP